MVKKSPKPAAEAAPVHDSSTPFGGNAQRALISFVERIERLKEEADTIAEDMKEVFSEAKGDGFDTAILRKVLAIRRMDPAKREEQMALVDLYLDALRGGVPVDDDEA